MTSRIQWIVVGVAVATLSALLGAGIAFNSDLAPVGPGSEAPDWRAVRLASGDTVSLEDYRGEVVLLNIWATWCAPCREEMPSLERLHQDAKDQGLRILGVSVDPKRNDIDEFLSGMGLTFEILHDRSGEIERRYQTTGLPESFIIDRHGVIVKKVIGAIEWDHPSQRTLIDRLLTEAAAQTEP